jgi:hypothetical protein
MTRSLMSQILNPHNFVQPLCYFPCISQHRTGIIFFKAARGSAFEDAQCVCSRLSAAIRAIIHSIALLLSLRGVDAVEPDLGFAYADGVAINDTGFA